MDRGIPTEAVLTEMRAAKTPTHYLVGTPRARLSQLEQEFLARPWAQVRDSVQVKLIEQDGDGGGFAPVPAPPGADRRAAAKASTALSQPCVSSSP